MESTSKLRKEAMRRMTPCKGCEKRHVGCHSECEDYKKFKEHENVAANNYDLESYFIENHYKHHITSERRHKR